MKMTRPTQNCVGLDSMNEKYTFLQWLPQSFCASYLPDCATNIHRQIAQQLLLQVKAARQTGYARLVQNEQHVDSGHCLTR